jgi:hypothetical protein
MKNHNGIIYYHDATSWYKDGKHHREDGPAIEWKNGDKEWILNGKLLYTSTCGKYLGDFTDDLPESFKQSIIKYELSK